MEKGYTTRLQNTGPAPDSMLGRDRSEIDQMAIDTAAILRRLIQLKGNSTAYSEDAHQRHQLLVNKIIEIQGLLLL